MNFDRNTIIGFALLAVLFFFYFYYNSQQQAVYQKEQARKDSIANALKPKFDTTNVRQDSVKIDSQAHTVQTGMFQLAGKATEQLVYAENQLFKIAFTNKGGYPKSVELKKFTSSVDGKPVILAGSDFNKISYRINTVANQSAETSDLLFSDGRVENGPSGSQIVTFQLRGADQDSTRTSITHQYIIYPDQYDIDFNVQMARPDQLLTGSTLNLSWQYEAHRQEKDIAFEKNNTQIGFMEDHDFDYYTIGRKDHVNFKKDVQWIGVRQRFFNAFLEAKNNFSGGTLNWTLPSDTSGAIVQTTANMQLKVNTTNAATIPFNIYYGPSDYNILKRYDNGYSKLVNLGQGMYAFVRPINQYIMIPVFNFFKGLNLQYGVIILILTLIIRVLISPLTYKSYLSGAKMKALRPEIAKLKEKFGNDQQAMSMEQMKLFREAGVNPLGGCVPALLQIPIFFALYSFFNASVDLRGVEFLWANDLSAFDDPIKFGFSIPLLGSHLSIFNILACCTSLLISVYGLSMSADQSNPMMKYMPYIFPVFMLFFFNNMPSALTWYYTVSNVVTLGLQFVIQNYVIDHDKILAKIQDNRKKPKTKSKWQERLEQMQEQQKQVQEKQKNLRKK